MTELNGAALDDEPLDGTTAVFGRLKLGALSDTLASTDAGRLLGWDVTATASLTLLQDLVQSVLRGSGTINAKLVSEVLAATDGGTFLSRLHGAMTTEGVALIEAMLASRVRYGLSSQSVVTLDLTPLSRYHGALFTDFTAVLDSVLKERRLVRLFSEVITLTEQVVGSRVKPGSATDTVVVGDTGRMLIREVIATASLTVLNQILSSVISSGGAVIRIASDAIVITDGVNRALVRGRTLLEALTLAEGGLGRDIDYAAQYTETVDVPDESIRRLLRTRITSEGISLLEFILSSTSGNRLVTASDILIIGDTVVSSRLRGRMASDLLGLTDAQLRALQRLMTLVDGVTFRDEVLRIVFSTRRTTEQLTLFEQAVASVSFAVLYDVRILLGIATPEIVLGHATPHIVLGVYH